VNAAAPTNRLDRWLDAVASRDARRPTLEASLLAGRFWRYAAYRMRFVAIGRGLALVLHMVEFWILRAQLGADGLVSAIVFSTLAGLLAGAWWGVLELLRSEIRDGDLEGDALARVLGRWLVLARRLAVAASVIGLLLALGVLVTRGVDAEGRLLATYAVAIAARLAMDLWVRTYYSGVYARQRVFRPMTLVIAVDVVGVVGAIALVGLVGPLALPVAMLLTTLASRGLLWFYTRRAYEARGIPTPSASNGRDAPVIKGATKAALAGASLRVGAMVVLFGLGGMRADETSLLFAFHVMAPLLTTAASWAQVFYLDVVRLDDPLHAHLRRQLSAGLSRTGVVVTLVTLGVGSVVAWAFSLGTSPALTVPLVVLLAILPQLGRLQLEAFAHRAFTPVALGAACMSGVAAVLATALPASTSASTPLLAALLGVAAGTAVLAWLLRSVRANAAVSPVAVNLTAWASALGRRRSDHVWVGRLDLEERSRRVADQIAARLAETIDEPEAVVVWRDRHVLWWAERPPAREDLLELSAGIAADVCTLDAADGPAALRELGRADGQVGAPLPRLREADPNSIEALVRTVRVDLPDASVWDLRDRAKTPRGHGLAPAVLADVWRQAMVLGRGGRPRPREAHSVFCVLQSGAIALIVAVPKTAERDRVGPWRARAEALTWSLARALPEPRPPSKRASP